MLSYRHAFHAGNHADVLKHMTLVALCRYMIQKEKPLWFIDTHAGCGRYDLHSEFARKNAENETGINKLWQQPALPGLLGDYVALIRASHPASTSATADRLRFYPGSPCIADALLRQHDKLWLHELHPQDYRALQLCFAHEAQRVFVRSDDGFAALKALLPPEPRRALVLIDPPYEVKQDYTQVMDTLKLALERFATGVYMVWHPLLAYQEAIRLPARLRALPNIRWLHATLTVQHPNENGMGMHGSGVFVINPPYTLADQMRESLPLLVQLLGVDDGAGFRLDSSSES